LVSPGRNKNAGDPHRQVENPHRERDLSGHQISQADVLRPPSDHQRPNRRQRPLSEQPPNIVILPHGRYRRVPGVQDIPDVKQTRDTKTDPHQRIAEESTDYVPPFLIGYINGQLGDRERQTLLVHPLAPE